MLAVNRWFDDSCRACPSNGQDECETTFEEYLYKHPLKGPKLSRNAKYLVKKPTLVMFNLTVERINFVFIMPELIIFEEQNYLYEISTPLRLIKAYNIKVFGT